MLVVSGSPVDKPARSVTGREPGQEVAEEPRACLLREIRAGGLGRWAAAATRAPRSRRACRIRTARSAGSRNCAREARRPTSSTTAIANSATISTRRARLRSRLPMARPPFSTSWIFVRADCSAGANPNSTPVQQRRAGIERHDGPVQTDFGSARQRVRRQLQHQVQRPERQHQPDTAAERRDHQALDQMLAHDARGTGAQGAPDGHVALAPGSTRAAAGWRCSRTRSAAPARRRPSRSTATAAPTRSDPA